MTLLDLVGKLVLIQYPQDPIFYLFHLHDVDAMGYFRLQSVDKDFQLVEEEEPVWHSRNYVASIVLFNKDKHTPMLGKMTQVNPSKVKKGTLQQPADETGIAPFRTLKMERKS